MFYLLFQWLNELDIPGAGLFNYLSFRAVMSMLSALIITILYGKVLIRFLQKKQVGESVRDLGLQGQLEKQGTPTMGGIIILSAIIIPTLLFANLSNIYVLLMLITTVWLGTIGFIDDYIKVFRKNKGGLRGKFKVIGQIGLGVVVASVMFWHEDIVILNHNHDIVNGTTQQIQSETAIQEQHTVKETASKSLATTVPFVKSQDFDYEDIANSLGFDSDSAYWILYILIITFIITAVSNACNLTDGLDGLATGTVAIYAITLAVFAYVSGNILLADYLNIMYIPNIGELVIFIGALMGATIGFLWYNAFPAQVFMGDTGSLTLGGIIAVLAVILRKELLIPLLCGIFLMESLSVILQVGYFKYTKKRTGKGRRIWLMTPLHHHYQKKGVAEAKIVTRFWIISVLLALVTVVTLKVR